MLITKCKVRTVDYIKKKAFSLIKMKMPIYHNLILFINWSIISNTITTK